MICSRQRICVGLSYNYTLYRRFKDHDFKFRSHLALALVRLMENTFNLLYNLCNQ